MRASRSFGCFACLLLAGCSGQNSARQPSPSRTTSDAGSAAGVTSRADAGLGAQPARPATATTPKPATQAALPSDFIATEFGGYKLGAALLDTAADAPAHEGTGDASRCNIMRAVVRDFRGAAEPDGHPDFEAFDGKGPTTGLLGASLGADHKPEYASRCEADFDKAACPYGRMTTSASWFESWYRNTDAVNLAYTLELAFSADGAVYTFQSKSFLPLDGNGFGNSPVGKRKHNFSFTTELHTSFIYHGGESFSFTGDDDLWVFINGRIAIDLGGLHPPESAKIALDEVADELGLSLGEPYPLELFHAERHSANSNFRVDTTIEFTECGRVFTGLM